MDILPTQQGERVHLVVMFMDICGSSLLASQLEPEMYSDVLEDFRQKVRSVSNAHYGQIIRIDGDGCILTFEHQAPNENAPQNAIHTALDIHEFVKTLNHKFILGNKKVSLRTAIHSGIVLLKKGDLEKGVIEILGNPTNTTSHLCNAIYPGDIAVTSETLNPHNSNFKNIEEQSTFIPKLEKTVRFKLINKSSSNKETTGNFTNFIGRKSILDKMRTFIRSQNASQQTLMITAEAGLGKSRLLREFIHKETSRDMLLFKGRCTPYLGTKTFQPIEQIFKSIELTIEGARQQYQLKQFNNDAKLLNIITAALNQLRSPSHASIDIVEMLKSSIITLCNQMPNKVICFVIDDWQWVDDSSSSLVEQLMQHGVANLKFIFAARYENKVFTEMNNVKLLSLQPLTKLEIEQIATSLIPGIEPFSMMRIQNHSGGNPLYLEELCHAIRDSRFNVQTHSVESWLESLIYTRFSQLSDDLKKIVIVASVIGFLIPKRLLELILEEKLSETQLKELAKSDFLFSSNTPEYIRFKHGITQMVIYKMIGLKERNNIHSRIIKQLLDKSKQSPEKTQHDQLAYHYKQNGKYKKSILHSKIAGEVALRTSTLDKAQAHYKNALELSQNCSISDKEKSEILNNYGRSCIVDPAHEHLPLLRNTLTFARESLNSDLSLWSEYWVGFLLYGLGYPQQSVNHFESCKKLATTLNHTGLMIQLQANLGQAYAAACQYDKAYKYLNDAINLKVTRNTTQRASSSLAYAISCKGFALGEQGYLSKAETCFRDAQNALQGEENVAITSVLNQRAVVNLWHGNINTCLQITTETEQLSRRMRSRYNYAQSIFLSSAAKFMQSQNDEHLERMIQSTNWLVYDGVGQNLSLNYGAISEALALKQEWAKLRIYAARGLKRARLGDRRCESQVLRSLAIAAKAGETYNSFSTYMRRAQISAEQRGSIREIENNHKLEASLV